jgi:molecular chaperone GrpE
MSMEDTTPRDEEGLKSKESPSSDDDHVEVEIKSTGPSEEAVGEGVEAKAETVEPDDSESSEAVDEVSTAEDRLREMEDRFIRLAAEFDNYKKRTSRQFAALVESTQVELITELLTIQDNFERALQAGNDSGDPAGFKKGIELILSQFTELLKRYGVEAFESVGQKFDPNIHEAVMTVTTDDEEEGTVVDEFAKGYKLKDRILRHAKVSVAKAGE